MIYYLEKKESVMIQIDDERIPLPVSVSTYLNAMLRENLRELNTFERMAKIQFGWKSMIPIWIDPETLLFPLSSRRAADTFYLNYFSIREIKSLPGMGVIISFINGSEFITTFHKTLSRQLIRCQRMCEWMKTKEK